MSFERVRTAAYARGFVLSDCPRRNVHGLYRAWNGAQGVTLRADTLAGMYRLLQDYPRTLY